MPGILDVQNQALLGGADAVSIVDLRHGEKKVIEVPVVHRGVAVDLTDWTPTALVSLRTATLSGENVTDLTTAGSEDTFAATVANAAGGKVQVGLDSSIWSDNPEPEGGNRVDVPCGVCRLQLAGGAHHRSREMVVVAILRHGTGTPPTEPLTLPSDDPDFTLSPWDLAGGSESVTLATQAVVDAMQAEIDALTLRVAALEP